MKTFPELCKGLYEPLLEKTWEALHSSTKEIAEKYASRGFSSPPGTMYIEIGECYKADISKRAEIIFDSCCQAYRAITPKPEAEEFSKELTDAISRELNRILASGEARFNQFNIQFKIPAYQTLLEQYKNEMLSEGRRISKYYSSKAIVFLNVEPKVSLAHRIIDGFKQNKAGAIIFVIVITIIAIGNFFDAFTKIGNFFERSTKPEPTVIIASDKTILAIALELKESFNKLTSGRTPPIPDGDLERINQLIKRIEQLDPGNGHVIYYRGFIKRWQNQRLASHDDLFLYLERAKNPSLHLVGDNGDANFCFDNWRGFCKQRQAYINHVLALDFEQAAKEEKNRAVALARLKAALEYAEATIKLYGEFNDPSQGTPTKTLAESLRKQISGWR